MARGLPDYGIPDYSFFTVETPVSDVIAERQGFSRLDNRGRVLWFDDFRNGLNRWSVQSNGTGDDPVHKFSNELSIGYHGCAKLDCVGNTGISMLNTTLVLPVSKRLGLEVGLRLFSNFGEVELRLSHNYSGTAARDAIFYMAAGTGAIELYDNLNRVAVYTPPQVSQILNSWITVKYVIDLESDKFVRCMLGNQQFDLSSYSLRAGSSSIQGYTQIIVRNTGTSAVLKEEWYCGYAIISGDEP